jgi:S-adenosylmethionine uptake transporter
MPPIVLALIGVLLGCVLDAVIKHLGAAYPPAVIAFWRYVFGSMISGAAIFAMRKRLPPRGQVGRHAGRSVTVTACTLLFFYCLTVLPIAEATVLIFGAPLLIPPFARWILGEKFRRTAMIALIVGFLGMLITVQGAPLDFTDMRRLTGIAAGVGAAVLYALSVVLLRGLAQRHDAVVISFLGNVFPALYLLVPAVLSGITPALPDLPVLALTGLIGFVFWLLMTQAYGRAPAQSLAAAEYSGLIWSALIGFVFFSEVPRWQVWAGGGVIIVAVMLAAWDVRARPAPSVD